MDRLERIAGWLAVAAGVALVVGAFLPWATMTLGTTGTATQFGMESGRGIGAVILGLAAIVVGLSALTGRRIAGNRATLAIIGVLALLFTIVQRTLINKDLDELERAALGLRDLTPEQFAAQVPTSSYGIGLWMIAIGGVAAIVASFLLPRQIAPRRQNTRQVADTITPVGTP